MCGRGFAPRFCFSWPNAKTAVMGAEQAAKTMTNVTEAAMKRKTGARGLRTILESVLLDTMYDLPSSETAKKVVLDEAVVSGENKPYVIHESEEPSTVNVEEQRRPTGSD